MSRPKLLDLFCGAGGAAVGYDRAGFEVFGVDIEDQQRYPFDFYQGDALDFVKAHYREFDVVHASPPCQLFSPLAYLTDREYPDLLAPTRKVLKKLKVPYVIENVEGARPHMIKPIMLCGEPLGLGVFRHRLFESNVPLPPVRHRVHKGAIGDGRFVTVAGKPGGRNLARGRKNADMDAWSKAMGIDWMSSREITQAIPPAYTEFIGRKLMDYNEHNWHACSTPVPPKDATFKWECPTCMQVWVWRRPPRPAAQWVRREEDAPVH